MQILKIVSLSEISFRSMDANTPVSSLFDFNAMNIVIDNNSDNYIKLLDDIKSDNNYNWFHIKNAYQKEQQTLLGDSNFYSVDFLSQINSSDIFKGLSVNTNHFKVFRDITKNFPELKYWTGSQYANINIKVEQLKVIHGKKVGRTLGIPTGMLKSKFRSTYKFFGR